MITTFTEGIPWALLVISAFLIIRLHGVVKNLCGVSLELNEEVKRLDSSLNELMREVERLRKNPFDDDYKSFCESVEKAKNQGGGTWPKLVSYTAYRNNQHAIFKQWIDQIIRPQGDEFHERS